MLCIVLSVYCELVLVVLVGRVGSVSFFFQAEDGIRYLVRSRGLGDVYKRQNYIRTTGGKAENPVYKEFGIKETSEHLNFNHLTDDTLNLMKKNITEYFYFNIFLKEKLQGELNNPCLLYTSPSPRDRTRSRMPSSA